MKINFYISVAASALSLVLSIVLFAVGNINQGLQNDVQAVQGQLQQQQQEINTAQQINQTVGPNLLRDMAVVSVKDEKMKTLLAKYGYQVNVASPTPAPGAAGAPAAPVHTPTGDSGLHP